MRLFMDAVASVPLVAQTIERIGNYFNNELYGRPISLRQAAALRRSMPSQVAQLGA